MKSFTLSELLVVMAVMVILLGIAAPIVKYCKTYRHDTMPLALRQTRALTRERNFGVMLIRDEQDERGTVAYCMVATYIPSKPLDPRAPLEPMINIGTKEIKVPDYDPAVVVYDRRGHLCVGVDVDVDGQRYTSTNQLVLDGEIKWLHRYMGGFAKQQRSPTGPSGPPLPTPRWGP